LPGGRAPRAPTDSAETRGYVARIMGLLGGVGEIAMDVFEIRLVQ